MRPLLTAATSVVAAGAACFCWGLFEAHQFTLRRVSLPVLPQGARDLRLLHLSDLHLGAKQRDKLAFLDSLTALKPDLVVNTGDNITEAAAINPLLEAMQGFAAPGVFVFGSNDYYAPHFRNPLSYLLYGKSQIDQEPPTELPWQQLRAGFEDLGWHDLTHRLVELEIGELDIAFKGTDDAHLGRDDFALVAQQQAAAPDLRIGVTHAPYLRLLDAFTADDADLIIAGHTHGGQVCLPGYGALITNCDIDQARVKGLSSHTAAGRTAALHVSAGLGTSPFAPYRFACRPEATLITLKARPA